MARAPQAPWSASPNARPSWWLWPQVYSFDGAMVAAAWGLFLWLHGSPEGGCNACWAEAIVVAGSVWVLTHSAYVLDRWCDASRLPIVHASRWPFRYREFFDVSGGFIALVLALVVSFAGLLAWFVEGARLGVDGVGLVALAVVLLGVHYSGKASGGGFRRYASLLKEWTVASVFCATVCVAVSGRFTGIDPWDASVGALFLALCVCSAFHSSLHQRESDRVLGFASLATFSNGEAALGCFVIAGLVTQAGWWLALPTGQAIAVTGLILLLTSPVVLRMESQTGTMVGDYAMAVVPVTFWMLSA
ncbi:MAG: hypothetical protein ACFB20_12445 [Opitutales bacterium]